MCCSEETLSKSYSDSPHQRKARDGLGAYHLYAKVVPK